MAAPEGEGGAPVAPENEVLPRATLLWNTDETVRTILLHKGTLLSWPTSESKGAVNFDSMRLNTSVLTPLLQVRLPQHTSARTVMIDDVREQDGGLKTIWGYTTELKK